MVELSVLVKATAILATALLAVRLLRRSRAAVRALLLSAAFLVLAALPAAMLLLPERRVEVPAAYGATPLALLWDPSETPSPVAAAPRAPAGGQPRPFTLPSWPVLLRITWAAGALMLALPLAVALWRLSRLRRQGRRWNEGVAIAAAAASDSGIRRRVDVFLHDALPAPMTCGTFRPAIGLPGDAPEWPARDVRQALVHELEHVRRRDWPLHLLARAVCVLYWGHPLVWIAWRQLCLESERACDDAVVQQADRAAYAEQLVSLARRLSHRSPTPLLSMADRSSLATRVRAVLDARVARGRAGVAAAVLIAGGAVAATILISPLQATGRAPGATSEQAERLAIPTTLDGPAFEAVSVRPNAPGDRGRVSDWHLPSGRFTGRNQTLRWFIAFAYAPHTPLWMEQDQVIGGPAWMDAERFTIEATAGRDVTTAELQRMVRRVLAERFGLRVHIETRERSAYRLIVARGDGRLGPGIRLTDDQCRQAPVRAGGELGLTSEFSCYTMPRLALALSERVGRPVVDRTGVSAIFNATLTAARTPEELAVVYGLAPSAQPAALFDGPSLFTALREQLGLELEPTRAGVDVLVVEALERPSPNDASAVQPGEFSPPQADGGARAFEVASIRRNVSGAALIEGPVVRPGGRLLAINAPLRLLVANAFGIEYNRIAGGPAWLDSDRFDVDARASAEATHAEIRLMLQALLEERFALRAHRESRERPIYALVRAREDGVTGPSLRPSAAECAAIEAPAGAPPPPAAPSPPEAGLPLTASGAAPVRCPRMFFPGFLSARQIALADFAAALSMFARRPVVDRTGLSGAYDLDVRFTPQFGPPAAAAPPPAADDSAPSLFTALEEQLGLKLEADRGPVEMLIVDGVGPLREN